MAADSTGDPEQPPINWDEGNCIAALARLEDVQQQLLAPKIDDLRLTIPRVIEPLRQSHTSPAALFGQFSREALGAASQLSAFRAAWQGAEVQALLGRAAESQKANSDLSEGAKVPRYEWAAALERRERKSKSGGDEGAEAKAEVENGGMKTEMPEVDVGKMLDEYKLAHPDFLVNADANGKTIKIQLRASDLLLRFDITHAVDAGGREKVEVECAGDLKIFQAITRCLKSRPDPNNLSSLLDMIAAYTTLRSAPCSRCQKKLGNNYLTPAARRSKETAKDEGKTDVEWEAIHEGCLP